MNEFTPKYIVVHDAIKKDIDSGKQTPGSFLPTEKTLITMYSASRTTIRKAMNLLQEEGYIEIKQGRGTKVTFRKTFDASFGLQKSHQFKQVTVENLFLSTPPYKTQSQGAIIDVVPVTTVLSKILCIPEDSELFRLQRVKLVNSEVFAYVVSYIPCHFCPNLSDLNGKITNLYSVLLNTYGIRISQGNEDVSAIAAGFVESKILDVKIGTPLLSSTRIAFAGNNPVEYSQTVMNPKLYHLTIKMVGLMDDEPN